MPVHYYCVVSSQDASANITLVTRMGSELGRSFGLVFFKQSYFADRHIVGQQWAGPRAAGPMQYVFSDSRIRTVSKFRTVVFFKQCYFADSMTAVGQAYAVRVFRFA